MLKLLRTCHYHAVSFKRCMLIHHHLRENNSEMYLVLKICTPIYFILITMCTWETLSLYVGTA